MHNVDGNWDGLMLAFLLAGDCVYWLIDDDGDWAIRLVTLGVDEGISW